MGDWRQQAACRDVDPELFFPFGKGGAALEQEAVAKQLCRTCLVEPECLEFALALNLKEGVYGGLSEQERASYRRRRQRRDSYQAGPVEPPKVDKKLCRRCRQVLEAKEFPRDKRSGDGLNSRCTGCTNETERERRAARRAVAS